MAAIQRYVDTSSSGGDGTTQNHSGATAAYASLSSWESSEQTDLTATPDIHTVSCAGSTADTTTVSVGGWTTDATGYIVIEGDRSAPDNDGFYSGSNVISTSHYRMAVTTGFNSLLRLEQAYTVVDGLQFYPNGSATGGSCVFLDASTGGNLKVYRCRMLDADTPGLFIGVGCNNNATTAVIDSNLIVNMRHGIKLVYASGYSSLNVSIHNNTIYGSDLAGIELDDSAVGDTWSIKNNCVHTTSTANADLVVTNDNSATFTYDNNAFEDSESTTNEISISGSASTYFVNPGTATTSNFHPVVGAALDGAGISIGETTDLDGLERDQIDYEVGAFQAAIRRFVDTSSTGGDGTSRSHTVAYASLSSWESSEQTSLTTTGHTHTVDCAGSTADTSTVSVAGWTCDSGDYIIVRGDRGASDGFYSGPNTISTSHYRLSTSVGASCLGWAESANYSIVDGIQAIQNVTSQAGLGVPYNGKLIHCRVLGIGANFDAGIRFPYSGGSGTGTADSNLVVNFGTGIAGASDIYNWSYDVYNNTVYGCATAGISLTCTNASPTYNVKNNAVHTTTTAGGDFVTSVSGTLNTDTNAFEDSESTTNEVSISGSASTYFTSPGTATSNDFTIVTGSALHNAGIQVGEDLDITETSRSGDTSGYDIGAFLNSNTSGHPTMRRWGGIPGMIYTGRRSW